MPTQLNISLPLKSNYSADRFVTGSCNLEAWNWIQQWPAQIYNLAIYGEAGSGKTYLAKIWQEKTSAIYLDGKDLEGRAPNEAINNGHNFYVLDNADTIKDEEWLLHFYNLLKEQHAYLLLCSRTPPSRWNIALADLKSRLATITCLEVLPPDDQILSALLEKLLKERGLQIAPSNLSYIVNRIERSFSAAQAIVESVDMLAAQEKKPLSLPLIKQALDQGI